MICSARKSQGGRLDFALRARISSSGGRSGSPWAWPSTVSWGGIAHRAVLGVYERRGVVDRPSRYPFSHGKAFTFDNAPALLCCYHPSQQNTFTGRLTPDMLLAVLVRARELSGIGV